MQLLLILSVFMFKFAQCSKRSVPVVLQWLLEFGIFARMTSRESKNIVLFADGTGNAPGSRAATNVWKMYQAIDLGDTTKQVAFYVDGVGSTSSRLLGGAFGLGTGARIRHLYRFLVQNYQPGDRIYAFGFSRGAYIIRALVGLIDKCGIIDKNNSVEIVEKKFGFQRRNRLNTSIGLSRAIKLAYRSYRLHYTSRFLLFVRNIMKPAISQAPTSDEFRSKYSLSGHETIEFIGIWDTVSAVGMPIKEVNAFLEWLIRYEFPDQILPCNVRQACQALALDDQRATFWPILWNESSQNDNDRIKQVWFAGAHATIGGGHYDDDLSLIPLAWMMDEAKQSSCLGLNENFFQEIKSRANSSGKLHESRTGFKSLYRFKPRIVSDICSPDHSNLGKPIVHHSVIDRIKSDVPTYLSNGKMYSNFGYAPAGLPHCFLILKDNGDIVEHNEYMDENEDQSELRKRSIDNNVSNNIRAKRLCHGIIWIIFAYFLFYTTQTSYLISAHVGSSIEQYDLHKHGALDYILKILDPWKNHMGTILIFTGGILISAIFGRLADNELQKALERAWYHVKWPNAGHDDSIKSTIFGFGGLVNKTSRWSIESNVVLKDFLEHFDRGVEAWWPFLVISIVILSVISIVSRCIS